MTPLNVLSVVSEIFPLIKTGGLADVAGALPARLPRKMSRCVRWCRAIRRCSGAGQRRRGRALDDLFGGEARIVAAKAAGLELFVIDAPHLYARDGDPYRGPGRQGLAGQRVPLRCAVARGGAAGDRGSCRVIVPTSCMRMTGRRVWRRPICIMPAALDRRR